MTTSVSALLRELEDLGVRFSVTDGRLRAVAPKDVLTDDHRQAVQRHREELLKLVSDRRLPVTAPPVVPVSRDHPLPLSFAQQRLWFLAQLEPGSVEYNAPMAMRLARRRGRGVLSAALARLVARHEVLRTRLVADEGGEPFQVIDPPPAEVPVSVVDVSAEPDPEAAADRLIAADERVPFDLAAGPLLRASLVRIVAGRARAGAGDASCRRRSNGRRGSFARSCVPCTQRGGRCPELPVQYADFAVWQRQWLTGEVLEGQLAYWRDRLAGVPVLELPLDRPRPAVRSTAGAVIEFTVPAEAADGLRALSRRRGASMFMTVLAAFTVLLARYCGQDDVVVGTPIANRNRAETRGPDRVLRQHAGAADRPVRRSDVRARCWAGSGNGLWPRTRIRICRSSSSSTSWSSTGTGPAPRCSRCCSTTSPATSRKHPVRGGRKRSASRCRRRGWRWPGRPAAGGGGVGSPALAGAGRVQRRRCSTSDRMARLVGHLVELFGEVVVGRGPAGIAVGDVAGGRAVPGAGGVEPTRRRRCRRRRCTELVAARAAAGPDAVGGGVRCGVVVVRRS